MYRCQLCPASFLAGMSLKKHTKRFHPDYEWKGWKCEHDDCDYTTEDHAKIVKHKKEGM